MHSMKRAPFAAFLLTILLVIATSMPGWAGVLRVVYERSAKDAYGNDLGYQRQSISSINDLPYGSPWRSFLAQPIDSRDLFTYAQDISKSMNQPLNLTISDQNRISCSSKDSTGYNISFYKHVLNYSSQENQKFVFLHELGHAAMLNAYPSSFNFTGLDYGPDNVHYVDEILPNHKTSWVEGWANAFAALKNNGKIFSLSLANDSCVAFLKNNSFDEMARNEIFVAKNLYDIFGTFPSGKDKAFNAISQTGPHYSFCDFCRGYLRLYPQDQVAMAHMLHKNSQGRMTLHEMLHYLNNGSNVVSRDMYAFLNGQGYLNKTTTATNTNTPKKSFWARLGDFFGGLFGRSSTAATGFFGKAQSALAALGFGSGNTDGTAGTSERPDNAAIAVGEQVFQNSANSPTGVSTEIKDLAQAEEEYFKAFAAYNEVLGQKTPDTKKVTEAAERLKNSKALIEKLKEQLNK